jgi:hypothetical protein
VTQLLYKAKQFFEKDSRGGQAGCVKNRRKTPTGRAGNKKRETGIAAVPQPLFIPARALPSTPPFRKNIANGRNGRRNFSVKKKSLLILLP